MSAAIASALVAAAGGAPALVRAADPSPVPATSAPTGPATPTGPVIDTIRFSAHEVDRAPLDLQAGEIDLYLTGLQPDAMRSLATEPGVRIYTAPSTSADLLLNPAPAPAGQLNPFSIREVRQAMQELVDRELVARDVYRGFAWPQQSFIEGSTPDYLAAYDVIRGAGIVYDPEFARHRIAAAMTAAGATLVDGRWTYEGKPVELRFVARSEDARRRIGDIVRAELERAGFTVTMQYLTYAPAVDLVYATDPAELAWHVYTESWAANAATRWTTVFANQYVAPWYGNMPGWGRPGYWQYENKAADEVGKRLQRGEFSSREERDGMIREMARIEQEESVRVWVASIDTGYPAITALTGMSLDVRVGPRSRFSLRTARIPGRTDLNVGVSAVWNESSTWNPVNGFGDTFSRVIWDQMQDPSVVADPWSGRYIPYRGSYTVETAGPDGALPVPADALTWDAVHDAWVPVPGGTTAKSMVTFDLSRYVGAPWHDGSTITLADALYPIIQAFELVRDPVKAAIEPSLASSRSTTLDTVRGYRFPDDHTIVVYVDYWHFDENEIAAYASPASFAWPWHVLAAADELVYGQRAAAYSRTAATEGKVPWLSVVLARDAGLLDAAAATLAEGPTIPAGLAEVAGRTIVTPEEASARYAALHDFFTARRHLAISSGPYSLVRFDTTAQYAELQAVRDPAYPMRPNDLQRDALPTVSIGAPSVRSVRMGEAVRIELPVSAPGTVESRWLLIDPATRLAIAEGDGVAGTEPGTVAIDLGADVTGRAFPGPYQLYVAIMGDELARVAERRIDLDIEP